MSEPAANPHLANWRHFLDGCRGAAGQVNSLLPSGHLTRINGLVMEASGLKLPLGSSCRITPLGGSPIEAEVVGFNGERLFLMPSEDVYGLSPGARVVALETRHPPPQIGRLPPARRRSIDRAKLVPVGESLLGRVLDGAGRPLDKLGPLHARSLRPLQSRPVNPMSRAPIDKALDVGVRAINGLLCVGQGQRMGLFAGSGVGKSVLLGMMARYTEAEIIVVGLIGERGREVKEFIEQILGEEGLRRSVVIAAPADVSPLMRLQGAAYATCIAEYFRDRGRHVLLIMDSLTRYAMAQREIALAIGEPPVTRGYPPSVFARLPQLVERAGNGADGGGSITGFYTVLAEGDDQQDPIADAARAILDGPHRTVANPGRCRPLPGNRHRAIDFTGHGQPGQPRSSGTDSKFQATVFALPALTRSDQRRRLCRGVRPTTRPGDSHLSALRVIPAAESGPTRGLRQQSA